MNLTFSGLKADNNL